MGLPEPEGPISRMLDFSMTTSRRSGSAMIGSGASRSQASTRRLKWLVTPRASRLLAISCPMTYWSRWATRDLGDGIDARRASREGRSGGGAGSGAGWGVISATAWAAQEPQMRADWLERRPRRAGWSLFAEVQEEVGHRAWGHRGRRRTATTTMVVERPLRRCQLKTRCRHIIPRAGSEQAAHRARSLCCLSQRRGVGRGIRPGGKLIGQNRSPDRSQPIVAKSLLT